MNNIFYIKKSNVHNVLLFIFLNVIVLGNLQTGVNTLHLINEIAQNDAQWNPRSTTSYIE